jgi:hydroxymethylbilane synthase
MTGQFPDRPLRLGTRASPLALRQAEMTRDALLATHGWSREQVELVPMTSSGDRIQDRALAEVGGKALWTRELDRAILAGEIDAAVHSMKDVETLRPDNLVIAAMLPRADVRDRIIGADSIAALPHGARIGTSSPRRTAQLLRLRPDLSMVLLRGNVATRLSKIAQGEADATLLASAGLERLGMHTTGSVISTDDLLPAPQQGAVGIEVNRTHAAALAAMTAIDHAPTSVAVRLERALLVALGGTCQSPVAALAVPAGDTYLLRAELFSSEGSEHIQASGTISSIAEAESMGEQLLRDAPTSVRALFGH